MGAPRLTTTKSTVSTPRSTGTNQVLPAYATHTQGGHPHPSWFVGGIGIAFLIMWLVAIMSQIQTNEALVTHQGLVTIYKPDWSIFLQIPELIGIGGDSANSAATMVGWGIELLYLGSIAGYEIMHAVAQKSGPTWAKLFRTCSIIIIGINLWTDYQYGSLGGGQAGHFLFAIVTSFIVGFFGTIGWRFIEIAWFSK